MRDSLLTDFFTKSVPRSAAGYVCGYSSGNAKKLIFKGFFQSVPRCTQKIYILIFYIYKDIYSMVTGTEY